MFNLKFDNEPDSDSDYSDREKELILTLPMDTLEQLLELKGKDKLFGLRCENDIRRLYIKGYLSTLYEVYDTGLTLTPVFDGWEPETDSSRIPDLPHTIQYPWDVDFLRTGDFCDDIFDGSIPVEGDLVLKSQCPWHKLHNLVVDSHSFNAQCEGSSYLVTENSLQEHRRGHTDMAVTGSRVIGEISSFALGIDSASVNVEEFPDIVQVTYKGYSFFVPPLTFAQRQYLVTLESEQWAPYVSWSFVSSRTGCRYYRAGDDHYVTFDGRICSLSEKGLVIFDRSGVRILVMRPTSYPICSKGDYDLVTHPYLACSGPTSLTKGRTIIVSSSPALWCQKRTLTDSIQYWSPSCFRDPSPFSCGDPNFSNFELPGFPYLICGFPFGVQIYPSGSRFQCCIEHDYFPSLFLDFQFIWKRVKFENLPLSYSVTNIAPILSNSVHIGFPNQPMSLFFFFPHLVSLLFSFKLRGIPEELFVLVATELFYQWFFEVDDISPLTDFGPIPCIRPMGRFLDSTLRLHLGHLSFCRKTHYDFTANDEPRPKWYFRNKMYWYYCSDQSRYSEYVMSARVGPFFGTTQSIYSKHFKRVPQSIVMLHYRMQIDDRANFSLVHQRGFGGARLLWHGTDVPLYHQKEI